MLDIPRGGGVVTGNSSSRHGPSPTRSMCHDVGRGSSTPSPERRSRSGRRPSSRWSDSRAPRRRTIWAKREDVNSGLAFGGNKTRKLEYLAADALAPGCDTLVSIGGVQSNHTRQVAAVAAHSGMRCVLVQESWVDWPDAVYDRVGNIHLSRIMGADVRLVEAGFGIGFKESWEQALAEIRARWHALRHPGGRLRPSAGRPGLRQLGGRAGTPGAELGVFFDTVIVCSVTGSTQAGMIAGAAAADGR